MIAYGDEEKREERVQKSSVHHYKNNIDRVANQFELKRMGLEEVSENEKR